MCGEGPIGWRRAYVIYTSNNNNTTSNYQTGIIPLKNSEPWGGSMCNNHDKVDWMNKENKLLTGNAVI